MNTFVDYLGMYHDKATVNMMPSSNNAWIYSAIANITGVKPYDVRELKETFQKATDFGGLFIYRRFPAASSTPPPISIDELVGMAYFFPLEVAYDLDKRNWKWYKEELLPDVDLKWWQVLFAILYLAGKHRNFVWKKEVFEAYSVVFKVYFNRYFFLKRAGWSTDLFDKVQFYLYFLVNYTFGDPSSKILAWVQYKALHPKSRLLPRKAFKEIYPEDHPFTEL